MQLNQTNFEQLMPAMIEWAEEQQRRILEEGVHLSDYRLDLARRFGVEQPERIRTLVVPHVPRPTCPQLLQAYTSIFPHPIAALTLGYGVYLRQGFDRQGSLLAHEFRHIHQFEQEGCSLAVTVPAHQRAVMAHGFNAPHEVDARMHEVWG